MTAMKNKKQRKTGAGQEKRKPESKFLKTPSKQTRKPEPKFKAAVAPQVSESKEKAEVKKTETVVQSEKPAESPQVKAGAKAEIRASKSTLRSYGDRKIKILKSRALELAEEQRERQISSEAVEIVEFVLSYERYGIASSYIREVYPLREFTPVPCTPDFVLGISNIRGRILTIIDIKKFFGLPEKGLTDLNRVIIVETSNMELGILADRINGIRKIPLDSLQATLPTLTGIRSEYLKGITEDRLVVLDVEKILADKRIVVSEEVET